MTKTTIYGLEIDEITKQDFERNAKFEGYDYKFEIPFIIQLPKDLDVIGIPDVLIDCGKNQIEISFKMNKDLRFCEDDND